MDFFIAARPAEGAESKALDTPPGWSPPIVYDVCHDTHRAATQADIDRLERIARAYVDLLEHVERTKRHLRVEQAKSGAPLTE